MSIEQSKIIFSSNLSILSNLISLLQNKKTLVWCGGALLNRLKDWKSVKSH